MIHKLYIFYILTLLYIVYSINYIRSETTFPEKNNVLLLTNDNFNNVITSYENVLVEFTAPWCGHCRSLIPEYEKAATKLKTHHPTIRISRIDATAHTMIAERYNVQSYPSIKYFKNGLLDSSNVKDYKGGFNADDIENWLIRRAGPSTHILQNNEELNIFIKNHNIVVLAIVKEINNENHNLISKLAEDDDKIKYIVTTNDKLMKQTQVKKIPTIILYRKFDNGKEIYQDEFKEKSIEDFIKIHQLPLIHTFSQERASEIFGGEITTHILLFTDEKEDYHESYVTQAEKAAQVNRAKIIHVVIPKSESGILEYFSLKDSNLPVVLLVNTADKMDKFKMLVQSKELIQKINDKTFSQDLVEFERQYLNGELKPEIKSARPVDDSSENVKIIVGSEFLERVINTNKDVLLLVYAPWSEESTSLEPVYEELAILFKNIPTIMIAKIDASTNEVDYPGVLVNEFPTILFFSGKLKGEPIMYDGTYELTDLTNYLKEKAQKFNLDNHDEL